MHSPTDAALLEEIRRRAALPWRVRPAGEGSAIYPGIRDTRGRPVLLTGRRFHIPADHELAVRYATFAANTLPALLEHCAKLEAELARQGVLEGFGMVDEILAALDLAGLVTEVRA